jgi:subtilisin-like proprotein convertase family protein
MRGSTAVVLALGVVACAHSDPGSGGDAGGDDVDAASVDAGETDGATIDAAMIDATPIDASVDAATDGAVDAMPTTMMWRDDTAAEFGAGTVENAFVEAYGAVSPVAYYTGGLLWRGANGDSMGAAAAATWAQVTAFAQTGKVAIAPTTSHFYYAETPPSVGLTDADSFTMMYEGEVLLDAGTYTFELWVDDHGFLEIAPSATGAFQRITSCDWPDPSTGTFNAPAAGWYPIRYAASEDAGDFLSRLQAMGPGLPALAPIPRHRLRARVSGITGMFQSGFDDGHLLGDVDHTIDQVTPANTNWNTGNPGDLGMTAADDFSVRWSGQFRVDVGGTYQFRYVTDDGQRLWVGNQKLLDAWDDVTHDQTSTGVTLSPGWHDLVVEHSERGGGAIASLSIAAGPELTGQTLPLDRLRPVEGRAERNETGFDRTDRAIPVTGQAPDSTVALVAPANATVTGVDVSYSFTHTYWGDLEVRLIAPNGATALLRDNVGGATSGTELQRLFRTDLNGAPVNGTWILRVNDTQASDSGTLLDFQVTVHHAAGEPPIATTSAYDSAVRDLGANINSITRVTWIERLPAGADIHVRMRTCDAAAACAAQPWSAALTDSGLTPLVTARRFAQYRVELTSNGDRAPALDQITVEYTVNP